MPFPMRAHRPLVVGSADPYAGFAGQKTQRPVITSSAGSSVIIASSETATPMASTGPMLLVEFSSASDRVSRLMITVPGAGDDGRPGPAQRDRHRLVPVLVPPQLLPVPGGEQQRVVGPRAEHQHVEDARGLRVDGEPRVGGEQVDERLGGDEGDAHGDDRQQPQDGAAVGEQQQDDDHGERGVEQRAVDPLERVIRVGRGTQRSRNVRRQAVRALSPRWHAGCQPPAWPRSSPCCPG